MRCLCHEGTTYIQGHTFALPLLIKKQNKKHFYLYETTNDDFIMLQCASTKKKDLSGQHSNKHTKSISCSPKHGQRKSTMKPFIGLPTNRETINTFPTNLCQTELSSFSFLNLSKYHYFLHPSLNIANCRRHCSMATS